MKKNNLKILLVVNLVLISSLFFISNGRVFAQTTGLVPCIDDCGFKDLITLINSIVKFILVNLAIPISAIMFAYAGFELVTSGGNTEKKSQAKKIFINVAIGLIFVAAAFLIVQTVLSIAGYQTNGWNWFGF